MSNQDNPWKCTDQEWDDTFHRIKEKAFEKARPTEGAVLYLLGSEPGAGTSTVGKLIGKTLGSAGYVSADADKFREDHPHYSEIALAGDRYITSHTHADARDWSIQLTEDTLNDNAEHGKKRNILVETTLADSAPAAEVAKTAKANGVIVKAGIVATPVDLSRLACIYRREKQKAELGVGRETELYTHHENTRNDVTQAIGELEGMGPDVLDEVTIYDRKGNILYQHDLISGRKITNPGITNAREALEAGRNRPATIEDIVTHYQQAKEVTEWQIQRGASPDDHYKAYDVIQNGKAKFLKAFHDDQGNIKKDVWHQLPAESQEIIRASQLVVQQNYINTYNEFHARQSLKAPNSNDQVQVHGWTTENGQSKWYMTLQPDFLKRIDSLDLPQETRDRIKSRVEKNVGIINQSITQRLSEGHKIEKDIMDRTQQKIVDGISYEAKSQHLHQFFDFEVDLLTMKPSIRTHKDAPKEIKELIQQMQQSESLFHAFGDTSFAERVEEKVNNKEPELLRKVGAPQHESGMPIKYVVRADAGGKNYWRMEAANSTVHPDLARHIENCNNQLRDARRDLKDAPEQLSEKEKIILVNARDQYRDIENIILDRMKAPRSPFYKTSVGADQMGKQFYFIEPKIGSNPAVAELVTQANTALHQLRKAANGNPQATLQLKHQEQAILTELSTNATTIIGPKRPPTSPLPPRRDYSNPQKHANLERPVPPRLNVNTQQFNQPNRPYTPPSPQSIPGTPPPQYSTSRPPTMQSTIGRQPQLQQSVDTYQQGRRPSVPQSPPPVYRPSNVIDVNRLAVGQKLFVGQLYPTQGEFGMAIQYKGQDIRIHVNGFSGRKGKYDAQCEVNVSCKDSELANVIKQAILGDGQKGISTIINELNAQRLGTVENHPVINGTIQPVHAQDSDRFIEQLLQHQRLKHAELTHQERKAKYLSKQDQIRTEMGQVELNAGFGMTYHEDLKPRLDKQTFKAIAETKTHTLGNKEQDGALITAREGYETKGYAGMFKFRDANGNDQIMRIVASGMGPRMDAFNIQVECDNPKLAGLAESIKEGLYNRLGKNRFGSELYEQQLQQKGIKDIKPAEHLLYDLAIAGADGSLANEVEQLSRVPFQQKTVSQSRQRSNTNPAPTQERLSGNTLKTAKEWSNHIPGKNQDGTKPSLHHSIVGPDDCGRSHVKFHVMPSENKGIRNRLKNVVNEVLLFVRASQPNAPQSPEQNPNTPPSGSRFVMRVVGKLAEHILKRFDPGLNEPISADINHGRIDINSLSQKQVTSKDNTRSQSRGNSR